MTDSALELAKLVNSDDFQRKLNDLVKEQKAAAEEKAKLDKSRADTEATMAAMTQLAQKNHAELAAAKLQHDRAAAEAGSRIKLANSMKADNDKRKAELDAHEEDLAKREKAVAAAHSQFKGALAQLDLIKP